MIKVLEVPLSEDLTVFAGFLWQHRVPHRIVEQQNVQQLWVPRRVDPEQIRMLYRIWREGGDLSQVVVQSRREQGVFSPVMLRRTWLSLVLIGLSGLVTLLIGFGDNRYWMQSFAIVEIQFRAEHIYYPALQHTLVSGQWWRFLTPALMHFNLPHILFNLLWVWVVGRRIELRHGHGALLGLVLLSALASNLAQFWVSGPMFGGMSGVVFALLGYAWFWDKRGGRPGIGLPPALMGFMLFWLVLGFTGVLESVGFGAIANTAHLVGLLAGLFWVLMRSLLPGRR